MGVAVNEVKDSVRAGSSAVDEIGPGDRALRRNAGAQIAETPAAREPRQIGEQTLAHHAFGQPGVHAVNADDDDFFTGRPRDPPHTPQPHSSPGGTDSAGGGQPLEKGPPIRFICLGTCHHVAPETPLGA